MNTWGYLILIAALLAVATLMLYARFSSRSRENSLHHGLDGFFSGGGGTMTPPAPDAVAVGEGIVETGLGELGLTDASDAADAIDTDAVEATGFTGSLDEVPQPPVVRADLIRAAEPAASPESSYMDELQEAAAGLAKLMRSSPLTTRAEPVVFAPEGETSETEVEEVPCGLVDDAVLEATPNLEEIRVSESEVTGAIPVESKALLIHDSETVEERVEDSVESLTETGGSAAIPSFDGTSIAEEEGADEPTPSLVGVGECDPPSRLTLLGEAVCEELDRIDAGLNSLEELVAGMESSLAVWAEEDQEGEVAFGSEDLVGVAA